MTKIATSSGGSLFDELRHEDENGEFWWARELANPLGYTWRGFSEAVARARTAVEVNGDDPDIHIRTWKSSSKSIGPKEIVDYRVTRYGAYAIIQGGDPRKPEIAAGWAYFREKTRAAEVGIVREYDDDMLMVVTLANKLQDTRNKQRLMAAELRSVAGRVDDAAHRVTSLEEDVADLKAITPLVGGVGGGALLTIRDAAHAVTGRDMGQNVFARWLVEVGVLFRDHNNELRCKQDWIRQELAQESWEAWQNGKGWSWVTRFTPRGLARIRQAYAEYGDDVRRTEDD